MKTEPLFIRWANREALEIDIVKGALENTKDDQTRQIAEKAKDNLSDLSQFRSDFRNLLEDLIDNGITQMLKNYVDSYMKPSLEEFVGSSSQSRTTESRWVRVKSEDTPWIEALVCYNLCLYIRVNGIKEIKKCPVCGKYFTNKGKYAKYCSDACKGSKV